MRGKLSVYARCWVLYHYKPAEISAECFFLDTNHGLLGITLVLFPSSHKEQVYACFMCHKLSYLMNLAPKLKSFLRFSKLACHDRERETFFR